MTGVITKILPSRGYGFVRGEDGISRFFHASDFTKLTDFDLAHEGQAMSFESIDMALNNPAMRKGNGLRATNIILGAL